MIVDTPIGSERRVPDLSIARRTRSCAGTQYSAAMGSRDGGVDDTDGAFAWVPGTEGGSWIAERLDGAIGSAVDEDTGVDHPALGWMVPRGYDAIVRILHPFFRQRPEGASWSEYERLCSATESDEDWARLPNITDEPVTWAAAIAALRPPDERKSSQAGSALPAPDSLSYEIVGLSDYGENLDGVTEDGYRYDLPREGSLDSATLARVTQVLVQHTSTPDAGIAAIWEGFGGLVTGQGVGYFAAIGDDVRWPRPLDRVRRWWVSRSVDFAERRRDFGTRAAAQAVIYRFLRTPQWFARWQARRLAGIPAAELDGSVPPAWVRARELPPGSGLLSRKAATGPRLELPDRDYVCFRAAPSAFTSDNWIVAAPWVSASETTQQAQSPSLLWPEDREWYLVSEIDLDSTLIACSRACANALLAAPGIEALEIDRDADI